MSYSIRDTELRDYVVRQIASGFDAPEVIVERAAETFEVERDDVDPLFDAATLEHARSIEEWPAVTDCDRLDGAFSALDAAGVVARHNFACCSTCGHSEMTDEIHTAREARRAVDGYVFYHWQDTDDAVDGRALHLRFNATMDSREAKTAIGARVVATLREHGLEPTWSGDPDVTVQLRSFVWRRRHPPKDVVRTWTAEATAELWRGAVGQLTSAEVAKELGEIYPEALVALGCADVALSWARAPLPNARTVPPRSTTLALTASALREGGLATAEAVRALWLEAYACVPWGGHGGLVDLLILGGPLSDPQVRGAAFDRASQTRMNALGAAAMAWYLVFAPKDPDIDDEHLLARVRSTLQRHRDEGDGVAMVEAALWVIDHRSGSPDVASLEERTLAVLEQSMVEGLVLCPQRAALAAAVALGKLDEVTHAVQVHNAPLLRQLFDAFVAAGNIDGAEAFAASNSSTALFARLARRVPTDARAVTWRARAEAGELDLDSHHEEGLITGHERRDARLELAALRARRGEMDRARAEIRGLAGAITTDTLAASAGVRSALARIRDGSPAPPLDPHWWTVDGEVELERALETWSGAATRNARLKHRRQGWNILDAAAAFAQRGDRERALALFGKVIHDGDDDWFPTVWVNAASLVRAWVGLGEIDRALAYVDESSRPGDAVALLVSGLLGAGRRSEALAQLGKALERAIHAADLYALAPAVASVADDPAACASCLLDAWAKAEGTLTSLLPPE